MSSLSALRKASAKTLETLTKPAQEKDKSRYAPDSRMWKPTFDKEKPSSSAVVRFLPSHPDEIDELPYVTLYSHSFKGSNGKWYIQNSLSSIGEVDPVGNLNYRLYNSGIESDKDVAKGMKRKQNNYANVLIIRDSAHPEYEGTVRIFDYGAQIAGILKEAATPVQDDLDDEPKQPINPFDVFEGADFVIKMFGKKLKTATGEVTVPDYAKSEFRKPSALFDGDEEKIEEIWNKCHKLRPLVAPDKFKSKSELAKLLQDTLGTRVGSGVLVLEAKTEDDSVDEDVVEEKATKPKASTSKKDKPAPVAAVEGSGDEDLDFLMNLDS